MFVMHRRKIKDYTATINDQIYSTLSFENVCNSYEYSNPESAQLAITSRSLRLYDNIVLDKMLDVIRAGSKIRAFTDDELNKYRFRPKYLSLDIYGVTDYWWIIMAVNGMTNDSEFENFFTLLIPDKELVRKYIDMELFKDPVKFTPS